MDHKYAPFYDSYFEVWKVIYNDPDGSAWYVHVPDAGSESSANIIADALNNSSE